MPGKIHNSNLLRLPRYNSLALSNKTTQGLQSTIVGFFIFSQWPSHRTKASLKFTSYNKAVIMIRNFQETKEPSGFLARLCSFLCRKFKHNRIAPIRPIRPVPLFTREEARARNRHLIDELEKSWRYQMDSLINNSRPGDWTDSTDSD